MNEHTPQSRDLYQEATDRIIKALENGTTPWQKPWTDLNTGPLRNGSTGNAYHGINTLLLHCASMERGFSDPRWLSFKQCEEKGYKVKKGAKSERIYFYKPLMVDERDMATGQLMMDPATGKPRQKQIPFLQCSPVFNAQEIEGIPPLQVSENEFSPVEAGESIAKKCPVEIRHGGNRAFYNPASDSITMPSREQFKTAEAYYATLAHEMIHSTGHKDRCPREFGKRFGDDAYAFEEMVAEMGSIQLGMETGLPTQIDNHASYISHWLRVLKSDKKAIFTAAAKASQAVDFVMGRKAPEVKVEAKQVSANLPKTPVPATAPSVSESVKTEPAVPTMIPSKIEVIAKLKARRSMQPEQGSAPKLRQSM